MSALATSVLTLVLLLLAVAGAGIFPWTLKGSALLLAAVALPMLISQPLIRTRKQYRNPLPWLFLYALLMLLPLGGIGARLTPIRAEANRTAIAAMERSLAYHPVMQAAPRRFALSRSTSGTLRFLLLITAGTSAWVIVRQSPQHLRLPWASALIGATCLIAITGILGKWVFPQGDTLYWYIPVPHGLPGPMGGFLNRNHFAGFLALLAPLALCLTSIAWKRRAILCCLAALAATLLLGAGTLLSFSRGGTIALLAGLLATTSALLLQASWKTRIILSGVLVLLLATGLLLIRQVPGLQERLTDWQSPATQEAATTRWQAWLDTLQIVRAYPVLGAGPNAFRTVYPQHRLSSERAARDFAENEYVQWVAETGLAGTLIALAVLMILVRQIWQFARTPAGTRQYLLAPAAIGALAAALCHASLDFPLRLPLYAITLAALAALLWPAPNGCFRTTATLPTVLALGMGLILALVAPPLPLQLDTPAVIASASPRIALRALRAAPTHPLVWRRLAAIHWQSADPRERILSADLLSQAASYDPNNYVLWRTLGERRQALGDNRGANAAYQRVRELRDWVRVPHLPEEP